VIIAAIPTQHLFAPHLGSFTELVDFALFYVGGCWNSNSKSCWM